MYILPIPKQLQLREERYYYSYDSTIVIEDSCSRDSFAYGRLLQKEIEESIGFSLGILRGASKKAAFTLRCTPGMGEEEYRICVNEQGIRMEASTDRGLLYAVQSMRQVVRQEGASIPYMTVEDYPDIAVRGYYHDVTRGRIPTLDYLKKLADRVAAYKLNQLQLYIEHTFLFEGMSEMWRDDTPLTAEEILELDDYCARLHIELIPSMATFGHLYKLVMTKTYQHLCELPQQANWPFAFRDRMEHHTLDASNPESFEVVRGLIDQYLPLFRSDKFNICGDETFDLGRGRSRQLAEEIGADRVYIGHIRKLCEYVAGKGKIPMFWGDIICKFPEAIHELPPQTICLSWGYDRNESDHAVRKMAEAGARQYCCPGVSGWNEFINLIEFSYENIKRMCSYAHRYDALGLLTTDWGDCGHVNHPDMSLPGLIYGAAFAWNREVPAFEEINRQISRVAYDDRSEEIVARIAALSGWWAYDWNQFIFLKEGRIDRLNPADYERSIEAEQSLQEQKRQLFDYIRTMDAGKREVLRPYLIAVDGMILLQQVGRAFVDIDDCLAEDNEAAVDSPNELKNRKTSMKKIGDDDSPNRQEESVNDIKTGEECRKPLNRVERYDLACRIEEWLYHYKTEWRRVSRESELYRVSEVFFWMADRLRDAVK